MKNSYKPKGVQFVKKAKGFYVTDSENKNDQSPGKAQFKERKKNGKNNSNQPMDRTKYRKKMKNSSNQEASKNNRSISDFISEGNPNIEKINTETKNKEQGFSREQEGDEKTQSPSSSKISIGSSWPIDEISEYPTEIRDNESTREQSENKEEQQEEFYPDEQLTRQIKEAINKEKSIPATDKGVVVSVKDGRVVLRGSVSSEQSKMSIGYKAIVFAGFGKVKNYLQVIAINKN